MVVAVLLAIAVSLGECGLHFSLLMLLCGDIETNPGPNPFELNISKLGLVIELLSSAMNNWHNLGLQLKVKECSLVAIQLENQQIQDCFRAMIKEWLKMIDPYPSWQQLVIALSRDSVGCQNLAVKIAQEYSIFLPTPSITVEVRSDRVATLGKGYSMFCSLRGADEFLSFISYQWMKDGEGMENECLPTLSFSSLSQGHAGEYSCRFCLSSPLLQHTITESSNTINIAFRNDEIEGLATEVSDSSDSASGGIPDQLQSGMDSLEKQFKSLADRTYVSIIEQNVDLITFRRQLLSLSVRNKILHQEFIKLVLSKTKLSSDFDELWTACCLYWTFLNYYLLEHLLDIFGDQSLKSDFKSYKDELIEFRCSTLVRDFTVYLKEMNAHLSKQYLKKLVVKLHKNWDVCTLEDLEQSKNSLSQKFFVPTYFFNLMDASPGSICITWAIPAIVAEMLKDNLDRADIVNFCIFKEIASLSIEGHVYHCTTNSRDPLYAAATTPRHEVKQVLIDLATCANKLLSRLDITQSDDMAPPFKGASNNKLTWRRGPDLPFAMTNNAQSVVVKGNVYMGGGVSIVGSARNFIVVKFEIYSGAIIELPSYMTLYFAMVVIEEQLVLVGGAQCDGKVSQKLGMWDADHKKWMYPYPDMTTPRSGCSAVVHKEWLVVAGGLTVAKEPRSQASIMLELKGFYAMTSSVEVLNTKTKQWYTVPDAPKPMYCAKTISMGNYGYFMGGADKSGAPFAEIYQIDFNALISYITSNDTNTRNGPIWGEISGPTQKEARDKASLQLYGLSPISINGCLHVVGGWNEDSGSSITDIFRYQPDERDWTKVGDMLYPRYYCTSAMISDNEMFVAMGESSPFQQPKSTYYGQMS